jgi:hypothetical protein
MNTVRRVNTFKGGLASRQRRPLEVVKAEASRKKRDAEEKEKYS